MNPRIRTLSSSFQRSLPTRATFALLAASTLLISPLAMAAGQPVKHGSAHTNIILQNHHHGQPGGGAHRDIILQHHHAKSGAHTDIILQHHHH